MGRNGNWYDYRFPAHQYAAYTLGTNTALLSIPMFAYFVILSLHVVGGWQAVIEKWKEGFGFFLLFSLGIYLSNAYVSVELAGILSSIVTITFGFLIIN